MSRSNTPTTQSHKLDAWEWRRKRACELHEQGWWQKDIAAALGVSRAAVCQWLKRGREGGVQALRTRPQPGPTPRLTAEQRGQLPALLARGAEAFGFRGDVWTASRVAAVIQQTFGVRYHRDEEAIRRWYAERWPGLQKKRARKAARSSG